MEEKELDKILCSQKKHRIEDEDVDTVKIGAYKEDMQKDMQKESPNAIQTVPDVTQTDPDLKQKLP